MSVTESEVELRQLSADALAHQNAGRFAEAAQSYAALLSRAPDAWVACYNLGLVYQHLQRLPEAAEMYARAVRINPNLAEGYNNLGNVLKALNNDSAAMESFEKALALNPQLSEAAYNLAIVLQSRDRLDDSIAALRAALAHGPLRDHAWDALYRALLGLGRQEEAITAFVEWESVTPLSPERVVAGLALCRPMGDRVREERYLSLALAWPFEIFTPEQFAPVLGMLQYFDVSADTILRCYRRYDAAVTARQPPQVALLARRAADSRIRVGYLSGDFRQHVMGRLMLDVVARHDRTRFSILLISTCAKGQHDATTAEFQRCADGFADVSGLDDFAAAKSIGEADIDILVDLSGHTNSARPGIYAHRPARNIVTHLGYHGCLGMSAVDYKLTDRVADLDHAAGWQIEKPYFLAPTAKGEKVYALLRETLRKEKKIGIAYVVIATRQHLAALIPNDRALMLFTLRWESEIRNEEGMSFPAAGKAGVKPAEAAMAVQLVNSMSGTWKPGAYRDTFRDDIMALIKKKVAAGKTTEIMSLEQAGETPASGQILDLTDLLKRSLKKGSVDAAPKPGSTKVTALKPKSPATKPKPPATRAKARDAKVKRPGHG